MIAIVVQEPGRSRQIAKSYFPILILPDVEDFWKDSRPTTKAYWNL